MVDLRVLGQKLTDGALDCNAKGQLLFDVKSANKTHNLKCISKDKKGSQFEGPLEGDKKMIRFFNNYVIEIKTENNQDKL